MVVESSILIWVSYRFKKQYPCLISLFSGNAIPHEIAQLTSFLHLLLLVNKLDVLKPMKHCEK